MSGDIGPGTLVICVNTKPSAGAHPNWRVRLGKLRQGRAYTVRHVRPSPDGPAYLLEGVFNDIQEETGLERGYLAHRFRKLNDGEDDAGLIAKIRGRQPVRERIDA